MEKSVYVDTRGWKYKVRSGIGGDTFKTFYCKPGKSGYHGCHQFAWRDNPDAAQVDLDEYAKQHDWRKIFCERELI
jgi:hypothetical protein